MTREELAERLERAVEIRRTLRRATSDLLQFGAAALAAREAKRANQSR
jgi:hypothetical protein